MVQILPAPTSLGSEVGRGLGQGLQQGISQGSQVGFQRGMLQNSLKGLEDLANNPNTTPYQLASSLIQATAGIPGAERYVGQIYPILLQQMRSQQAFGQPDQQEGMQGQPQGMQGQQNQSGGALQGLGQSASRPQSSNPGGILGRIKTKDEIDAEARRYVQATGTGEEGYRGVLAREKDNNDIVRQQRDEVERKAKQLGIKPDEIPLFMQIGEKHQNANSYDDFVRNTKRDFDEVKNLSTSLEKVDYPGLAKGLLLGAHAGRTPQLERLQGQVKRLIGLGFEQDVRKQLADKQLSPTEIEEVIHPIKPETKKELFALPDFGNRFHSAETEINQDKKMVDFLKKNINKDTSILVLRDLLSTRKNYSWERVGRNIQEAIKEKDLTAAQQNELATVESEPPRQSLGYIFNDVGNLFNTLRGQK